MKRFLQKMPPWTLTVVVVVLIIYLTLVPQPLPETDIQLFPGADKLVHAIMFGALAGAICLDVARRRGIEKLTTRFLSFCFLGTTIAGAVIEFLQKYMNVGRSCELWDFVADTSGALLAVIIARPIIRILLQANKTPQSPSPKR